METTRLTRRDVSTFLARLLLQSLEHSCLKHRTSRAKKAETSRLTRRDASIFLARVLLQFSGFVVCANAEKSRAQCQCEDPKTQNRDHLALGNLASRAVYQQERGDCPEEPLTHCGEIRGRQDAELSPDAKPEEREIRRSEDKT